MADITTFSALQTACQASGTYSIGENITFAGSISIPSGVTVKLSSDGGPFTLSSTTANQRHFTVSGTLQLGNIVLDGGSTGSAGGGGIYAGTGGIVTLNSGAILQNCYNSSHGGAVYLNGAALTANGATFQNNANGGYGAGVYGTSATVNTQNCTFVDNQAVNSGGGIYIITGAYSDTGSVFSNNSSGNYGGAAFLQDTTAPVAFNSTQFLANQGSTAGGVSLTNYTVAMNQCIIEGNTSSGNAGGLLTYRGTTNTITGGSISQNTAASYGGGILFGGSGLGPSGVDDYLTLNGVSITNNSGANGGGIAYLGSNDNNYFFTATDVVFDQNQASSGGGGICAVGGSSTTLQYLATFKGSTAFTNNTATASGGGLYLSNLINATFQGIPITGNSAQNGAGYFLNSGTLTTDSATIISSNTASQKGGGGYVAPQGILYEKGATYASNTSASGGGLYVAGGKGYVYGSTVTQNITSANGGGIYVDTSSFVFSKGLTLTHNKSRLGKGGGAYVLGQFITAEVEIHYNSAAVCGGGVCVE
ncbi:MAG: hypothetical protein FWF59_08765 [Turicibacter sp.]|nr:hypothetical protein [Turicibacter sp.]